MKIHYSEMMVTNKRYYNADTPNIKEKLQTWFDESKDYLIYLVENNALSEQADNLNKWMSNMTVPQLSLFFRLLNETEIAYHKNKTETFRLVSKTIRTKNQPSISSDSIKAKYYSKDEKVIHEVKLKLMQMLRLLTKL